MSTKTEEQPREQLTIPVAGMHCASCVLRIEHALEQIDGVARASANLALEQASVEFDPRASSVQDLHRA
ncbi:MAG: heavy metal-associated domain-containing protein, partial [Dehalococcoidia bacterium]